MTVTARTEGANTVEIGGSPSLAESRAGPGGAGVVSTLGNQTARGPTLALPFTSTVTLGLFSRHIIGTQKPSVWPL